MHVNVMLLIAGFINLDSVFFFFPEYSSLNRVLSSQSGHTVQVCIHKFVKKQRCLPLECYMVRMHACQNEMVISKVIVM